MNHSFDDLLKTDEKHARRGILRSRSTSGFMAWLGGILLGILALIVITAVIVLAVGFVLWLLYILFMNWDIASTGNWQYENQQWGR